MKRTTAICILVLMATTPLFARMKVHTRAVEGKDLSGLETYSWLAADKADSGLLIAEGSRLAKRVESVGDEILTKSGFERSDAGESQMVIRYRGLSGDMLSVEGTSRELGGGVTWVGDPHAHSMESYQKGALLIEVLEAGTEELLWAGWAADVLELMPDRKKLEKKTEKAVRKILKELPID